MNNEITLPAELWLTAEKFTEKPARSKRKDRFCNRDAYGYIGLDPENKLMLATTGSICFACSHESIGQLETRQIVKLPRSLPKGVMPKEIGYCPDKLQLRIGAISYDCSEGKLDVKRFPFDWINMLLEGKQASESSSQFISPMLLKKVMNALTKEKGVKITFDGPIFKVTAGYQESPLRDATILIAPINYNRKGDNHG